MINNLEVYLASTQICRFVRTDAYALREIVKAATLSPRQE